MKYRLIDEIGPIAYCDPDQYPITRGDEDQQADRRIAEIRADHDTYAAIAAHLQIDPAVDPTAAQRLAIYRAWKVLNAVRLEPAGGDSLRFDFITIPAGAQSGFHVIGTITRAGEISVQTREPSGQPPCPICLARGTMIETPSGSIAVERLRPGSIVWTRDAHGRRVAMPIAMVGRTPVPASHLVVRIVLDDGRSVLASPRHPLVDGRLLGSIQVGEIVDGSRVVDTRLEPYAGGFTFDLLPAGPTGIYWADGIPLGSTLR